MANQMIALQARSPQLPDPSRRTAQFVNMMNMTRQQEAAQRQAEQAQQAMTIEAAKEARAAELHGPALTKAQQDNILQALEIFREGVADIAEGDIAAAEAVRADLVARVQGWDKVLPPAASWDRNTRYGLMMKAEKEIEKTVATPTTELIFGPDNKLNVAQKGGFNEGLRPLLNRPAEGAPAAQPSATPTAPQPAPAGPVPAGEFGEARFVPEDSVPLTPFQQEHIREMQSGLGMSQPASFSPNANAGQMTPDVMSNIVNSAFETGVMAQVDFDQLLATQPPQNKQALVDSFRRANITLQADAPSLADSAMGQQSFAANPVQTPQAEFAVYRGQPREQTLAQTNVVGQQAYGRSASPVSPTPGIYNVPTQDVAATSRATRPSAKELYDAEAAKIKAVRDAGPAPLTSLQKRARQTEVAKAYTQTQGLINKTYDPKEGVIALARKIKMLSPDQKEALTGFSNYVPSFRESSREADTLFGNLKGVITAAGKDAAAASGAIGPIAVQEWKIVADQIANLDLANMTPRALDAQMDRIIRQVGNATNLARQVYDVQYGDDVKEYPAFKVKGIPSPTPKTPVVKGKSRISPDIENILKSRGL